MGTAPCYAMCSRQTTSCPASIGSVAGTALQWTDSRKLLEAAIAIEQTQAGSARCLGAANSTGVLLPLAAAARPLSRSCTCGMAGRPAPACSAKTCI